MPAKFTVSQAQAIAWHIRVPTLGEGDWADFVAWLESSPHHRSDYDNVAFADILVGQAEFIDLGYAEEEEAVYTPRRSRSIGIPFVIVASLALALALATWAW